MNTNGNMQSNLQANTNNIQRNSSMQANASNIQRNSSMQTNTINNSSIVQNRVNNISQPNNINKSIIPNQNNIQSNITDINKNIDFTKIPVVDAVNMIIITAVDLGASDIHFDPTDDGINVRIRVDGILRDKFFLPKEIKQNITTRIKIMAGMNITETRLPQDGGIKDNIKGRALDLRVSSLPTKRGEKIVIRIMDYSMSLKGIEYLCFS